MVAALWLFVPAFPAGGGDHHVWIDDFKSADGWGCCGPSDTAKIDHAEANSARIGSQIIAEFPTGPHIVTVNAIYPTRDPKGLAYITRYGCLFRWSGG